VSLKLYFGFPEQVYEGIVGVVAKGDEALYPGIDQHLSTKDARTVGAVDGGAFETDAVKRGLYDDILLGMNTTAYFMPGSRFYAHLVPEAAQFKAVFEAGGSPVVAGG